MKLGAVDVIADSVIKSAGKKLNLRSVVELPDGSQGYIEVPQMVFEQLNDTASITVYFPERSLKRSTTFDSKKYIKRVLKYVKDYDKQEFRQSLNKMFKHPKDERKFIDDVLRYLGGSPKSVWDIMPYLVQQEGWRFKNMMDPEGLLTSAGFEVKDRMVHPGKHVGKGIKTLAKDKDFPTLVKNNVEKRRSELDSKGCIQLKFGDEFIEESYIVCKDYDEALRIKNQGYGNYKGMQIFERPHDIYKDSTSGLYWVDTGAFD